MSRTVLTYPDLPPVMTQAAADIRYVNVAGDQMTGNLGIGVTPHAGWPAAQRVLQIGPRGALSDNETLLNTTLGNNTYWDGSSSRSFTTGPAATANLNQGTFEVWTAPSVTGVGTVQSFARRFQVAQNGIVTLAPDAGSPAMLTYGNVAIGNAAYAWHPSYRAIDFPNMSIHTNTAAANTLEMGVNSYVNAGGTRVAMVGSLPGSILSFVGGYIQYAQAATVPTNTAQTFVARFSIDTNGTMTHNPAPGNWAAFFGQSVGPQADNFANLGYTANRWIGVYAVLGTIQTSVYQAKELFAPLDPTECAAAVLETDWVRFAYRPSERTAQGETVGDTALIREQKGYVLQSPVHKVADLFGLADRESANASSDLAVVACALQQALRDIADLKARLPA